MTAQPYKELILGLVRQSQHDEESFWQGMGESERDASGTWERWSAKDHIAHRTFWRKDLNRKLEALVQHQEIPETSEDEEGLNANTFQTQTRRSWSEIQAESEQAYTELLRLTEQLSEEELTSNHYPAITGQRPLYATFLGGLFEHEHEHLAQYYVDHDNLSRAIEIREECVRTLLQSQVPDVYKGYFLYNLAGFYTQQNQLPKARAILQDALTHAPELTERSKTDPDLAALHA